MEEKMYQPVSVGNWMITYLLLMIPVVNIVLIFVWAFGSNTPVSKANWAKASLLWMVIGVAFYIVLFGLIGVGALAAGL